MYCHEHLDISVGQEKPLRRGGSFAYAVGRLIGNSSLGLIPDPGSCSVPSWIRQSKTIVVIDQLLHCPDQSIRWSAAYVLRKRRDTAAIDPLWQIIQFESSGLVRQQAAVALGKIGTGQVFGPLVEGLVHDSDPGARQACAIALGNLGDKRAAEVIATTLGRERAAFVRWDCVYALGRLADYRLKPVISELALIEQVGFVRDAYAEILKGLPDEDRT